jgi:hypothetical protein
LRAELEARAGGNPSWNTGVNYRTQFAHSVNHNQVKSLYQAAGLDLEADLKALEDAPRIAAVPSATSYLAQYLTLNGQIQAPVLTMHTTADGLVAVENEQAYASVVHAAGNNHLLRQIFVHRAGHCMFTPAETLTAFQMLLARLQQGHWGSHDSQKLNAAAAALGALNNFPPAFIQYHPAKFLRP